jgi:hypothetical protein
MNSEKMAHRNAGRWLNKCGNTKGTKYATSGQIREIGFICARIDRITHYFRLFPSRIRSTACAKSSAMKSALVSDS